MKILYVARLFSGLERSVQERRWVPTGVPTIYRVIEALAASDCQLSLLLCAKDGHSSWTERKDLRDVRIDGLRAHVDVLAGRSYFPDAFGRLAAPLREIRHNWHILRTVLLSKPDLVYIDHGNIWTAGLLARIRYRPVILRIMGVYPAMRSALTGGRLADAVLRWNYKGPYTAVICSQDGSGVEPWLANALRTDVKVHTLMNGVDPVDSSADLHEAVAAIPAERIVVLFLGKIEHTKGAEEFARGFVEARAQEPRLHALMIGSGALTPKVRELFAAAGHSDGLTLVERMPHKQVMSALRRADIYVSLNRFGNLSNANLEAMRVGVAMIFPASQPETCIDQITDTLIPAAAALRIKSSDDIQGLTAALIQLACDPERRSRMASAVREIAAQSVGTWDARIDKELSIIREAAAPC